MNPGPHHMYGSKYECNLGKDPDHEMLSSQGQNPDFLAKEERLDLYPFLFTVYAASITWSTNMDSGPAVNLSS